MIVSGPTRDLRLSRLASGCPPSQGVGASTLSFTTGAAEIATALARQDLRSEKLTLGGVIPLSRDDLHLWSRALDRDFVEAAVASWVARVITKSIEVAEHESDAVQGRGKLLFIGSAMGDASGFCGKRLCRSDARKRSGAPARPRCNPIDDSV